MRQFSVFKTRSDAAQLAPYLVVLQHELLSELASVIVAPMRTAKNHGAVIKKLQVPVSFDGGSYVVTPEQLVSLPRSALGPPVGILTERQELKAAIDFMFIGY